ncbi:MAG TPA: c-type cytochrome [Woeseiaceae bacterium]|nr:c-type cytochrome [Woeseiaceae bacterium]
MISLRPLLFFTLALACAACHGPGSGTEAADGEAEATYLTAATLGEQVVLPTADYLELPRYRNASFAYGKNLAMQCRACHTFEKGAAGSLGPSLYGLFGRRAGSVDGYPYSPALAKAGFYWTPRALDGWLTQPGRFLPGNAMAFAGLPDQEERDAVIAALLRLTAPPAGTGGG